MLHADKENVEASLKQALLAIRERELMLYANNCTTVGTSAAVLASFAFTMQFVAQSFHLAADDGTFANGTFANGRTAAPPPPYLRVLFIIAYSCAIGFNITAMWGANLCALFGPGLALRGPDGSYDRAVEGLALEYRITFLFFFAGILSIFATVTVYLLSLVAGGTTTRRQWYLALVPLALVPAFLRHVLRTAKRLYKRFRLPAHLTVSGAFTSEGTSSLDPAVEAARLAATGHSARRLEELSRGRKRLRDWPLRQYLYLRVFMDEFVGISAEALQQKYNSAGASEVISATMPTRVIANLEGVHLADTDAARFDELSAPVARSQARARRYDVGRRKPWGRLGKVRGPSSEETASLAGGMELAQIDSSQWETIEPVAEVESEVETPEPQSRARGFGSKSRDGNVYGRAQVIDDNVDAIVH